LTASLWGASLIFSGFTWAAITGPLDTSQWISLLLLLLGASYFVAARRRVPVPAVQTR
jgi:hypothetical protein